MIEVVISITAEVTNNFCKLSLLETPFWPLTGGARQRSILVSVDELTLDRDGKVNPVTTSKEGPTSAPLTKNPINNHAVAFNSDLLDGLVQRGKGRMHAAAI